MEVNSQDLIKILSDNIKLYEHLGITVETLNSHRVVLKVDLQKNLNHKGTAFGGSLYATGVLSAYALVLAGLKHYQIDTENIVIAKGVIEYHRPIDSDFRIVCAFADLAQEQSFYQELKDKKRVRRDLQVHIFKDGGSEGLLRGVIPESGVLGASLVGSFVVRM
ncbi:thioesterase domain-containing protein [Bdellovibrio sp. SKB1291214]|uniref:YiiD C-terminal domain-containing protein n=1 Tax=Bdellovibrio sp. SKB1291214 TaxID=1732569 RepID=UPI000B51B046|nr:YiiD C-terminal domain-containing protein [Bdellovibrio sp. SKB1291214]UYL07717.1 thioesterase domain-containing protein [Bdellovibrio sp. SKB1291214]